MPAKARKVECNNLKPLEMYIGIWNYYVVMSVCVCVCVFVMYIHT